MSTTPIPPTPRASGSGPLRPRSDALARMLTSAVSWDTVPAGATPLVTGTSWALLSVSILALLALARSASAVPALVLVALDPGVAALAATAICTRGFRRASHRGFQLWTAALVVASIATVPAALALVGILVAAVLVVALGLLVALLAYGMLG